MEKGKKVKLNYTHENDYSLIAISLPLSDFQFSWHLNQKLNFKLAKRDDIVINENDENTKSFSVYMYYDELDKLSVILISNKSDQGVLIKDLSNIDFFIRLSGANHTEVENTIISTIKEIESMQLAYKLNFDLLGTRNKNIFLGIFQTFD